MVLENDFLDILHEVNFTGLQADLLDDTGDQRSNINSVSGNPNLNYYILTSKADLDDLGYYTATDIQYTQLPSNGSPALDANGVQAQAIQAILHGTVEDNYSVTFKDVSLLTFTGGNGSAATILNSEIIFGQITNNPYNNLGQTETITSALNLTSIQNGGTVDPLKHGDVFLNDIWNLDQDPQGIPDWFSSEEGAYPSYGVMHEIGHALGIDHPSDSNIDSMQYTIMSANVVLGMNSSDGSITTTVTPTGLQLLDIAAIQAIYGTNWTARNEELDSDPLTTGTEYSKITAFASDRPNGAFIYTIWDGGGTTDTIDASGYTDGVEINLNQGEFSSIGKSADATFESTRLSGTVTGLAKDNVAIAYKTEIENAIGTVGNDHIIGNDLDNLIVVGAGTDTVVGHDGIDTLDYHGDLTGNGMSVSIAENNGPTNGTIIDGWGDTDYFADIENFILTNGDDTVYVIQTGLVATDSVFDGGDGHDKYTNATGILEVKGDELWVWDEFGQTHDVLDSFEEIVVDKIVPTSMDTTAFNTLITTGSRFNDIDYRDAVGDLTFTWGNNLLVTGTGINHDYSVGGVFLQGVVNIVGNNGNNFYDVSGITKNLYTGTGNDTVEIDAISSNVNVYYTGGDDTYNLFGDHLNVIRLGENIVHADIDATIVVNPPVVGSTGFQAIVSIGSGSITLNQNVGNFDPIVMVLESGELFVVQKAGANLVDVTGAFYPSGSFSSDYTGVVPSYEYHSADSGYGTWDKDIFTMNATGGTYRAFGGKDEVDGGVGDDTIYGGSGLDTLYGGAGNDTLYGGDDKDDIDGGAGTNTLYGNLGADTFRLGEGDDTATGGEGADIYIIKSAASGSLTVTDFDINEDRIDLKGLSDPLDFSSINWTVYGNNVEFNVAGAQYSVTLTNVEQSSLTASNFVFGAGAPYVYNLPLVPSIVETGSAIGEVMDFSFEFDARSIEGLGGNDTLIGTGTNDHLYGGDGDDILNGGYGNDVLFGGDGSDDLYSSFGDDYYVFNTDTETGFDSIYEFMGVDTIVLEGSIITDDIDVYSDGANLRIEELTYGQTGQFWSGLQIVNSELFAESKVEYIVVQDVVYDLYDVFNTGIWTPYVADTSMAPNAFDDLITIDRGGVVTGSVFNDNGSGSDYDSDGTYLEVDAFSATGAYGTFDLLADGSFIFTGTQNHVGTQTFSYTLRDADGLENQAIITLNSIVSNSAPVASAMDSNLVLQAGGALSFVSNFTDPDGDTITYSATLQDGNALPSYIVVDPATGALTGTLPATSQATIGVRVIAADWMSQTIYDFDLSVNDVIAGTAVLDYLHGDAGIDTITGDDGNDRLYGYEGDDILDGQAGSDYIYGHEGNDTLTGDAGGDSIYGLEGDDTIYGGADNDILRGDDTNSVSGFVGAGNDVVYGDSGNDNISGGDGDDELHGGTENDVIHGDDGADVLYGDDGADFLYGGVSADFIDGGDGNDKLYGEAGTDVLIGGSGTDTLYGGDDNDILIGGTGTDFLYGQGGADIFTLDLTSIDRLSDFDASEGDTINISDLLIGYDSATDDINDFVTLVYRNAGRTDIRVNDDGVGNDLPYVGIVFSDLTGETVNTLVTSGTLIVE